MDMKELPALFQGVDETAYEEAMEILEKERDHHRDKESGRILYRDDEILLKELCKHLNREHIFLIFSDNHVNLAYCRAKDDQHALRRFRYAAQRILTKREMRDIYAVAIGHLIDDLDSAWKDSELLDSNHIG
jgi:hypothetical protein